MNRITAAVVAGMVAGSAHAHHSNDYHFDRNVGVTVSGTVKMFRFINPHSRLLVDVTGEDGSVVTWDCEMGGANVMTRRGWTQDVFQPGDEIVIQGIAARRHETECYFDSAEFADGRVVALGDSFDADAPEAERRVYGVSAPAGAPNFSRVWHRTGGPTGGGPTGGGPRLGAVNVLAEVLNEAGRQALAGYDPVFDDPALSCSPVSIRRLWSNNDLHEIEQTQDQVVIRHEWMDAVRVVHLGMEEHPANLESRVLGHSIGRYEGSTLVIDTIGYEAGMWTQHPGLPHSDRLHTVERLTLGESGDSFELTIVAEDALYYTEPVTTTRSFRASDQVPREYNCTHPELGH
ncbi:MAG: DUF6152 family protein [Rhodospirillaceae bacterium]|nr:DUF6152 family protein [Rhodospirillaceae bacterium]MDE0361498.1 DUF6152 family protein [Rhodospirillaceae bacterium]